MATIVTRSGKGSALTFTEGDANFTNLNNDKIELTSLSVTQNSASGSGALSYNNTTGAFTYTPPSIPSAGISNVSEDTTPQLGGSLDVNGNSIVSTSAGNISITPDTTGKIILDGLSWPTADGYTNQYLKTDGAGNLSWNSISTELATDYSPQLVGELEGQGNTVSNIKLEDYKETIYTGGSTTGTITPDVVNGNVQSITLTGNITFNAFANPEAGQSMTIIITQPSSGGPYTLTSTMKFAGGSKTLSTTASAIDIMTVFYDGTNYWASLATNFS